VTKSLELRAIFPRGKDSDDLLIPVNIVVSLVFSDPFKTFHPIEEDRPNVRECRVSLDLCHSLEEPEVADAQI
jgi:hypothetical protein